MKDVKHVASCMTDNRSQLHGLSMTIKLCCSEYSPVCPGHYRVTQHSR